MKEIKSLLETISKLRVAQKHKIMLLYMGMVYLLLQGATYLILANQLQAVVERFIKVVNLP